MLCLLALSNKLFYMIMIKVANCIPVISLFFTTARKKWHTADNRGSLISDVLEGIEEG